MKFGHFDDVKKEYVISNPRTPYPWINYLGTQEFFSLISNTAGGYSFYKDARLRRITRYRYNNVPIDMGGRYFYIKDGETIWNPGWSPVKTELDFYECRHGMGYTIITGKKNGLKAEATFFVPQNYNGDYYNSDYYYQCNETNAALRESVKQMIEKWDLDEIDCDKIEANSSLTLDGGFDFNSTWNFEFRNQAGRSSLAKESAIPPENFKMFFKEQVTSFTEDNKFNGNLKITIGENNYDLKVPFQTLRTGSEGEICNVWDLMEDYYPKSEDTSKVKNFLGNMSVFTRWYAYETRINDIFGDYEVSHKELS